ncbi:hypothetical protein [Kaistia nematophila]|uniref:Uncharacterized protein n=1 Tax=Kaistia nematophila TaxID=2994654 RepID=A0A9X3E483_9HYPH|nr:hypothetical protein [Kaistia nematophila]MCX5571494.1 hypothetical protein [Kaistia nematophila]
MEKEEQISQRAGMLTPRGAVMVACLALGAIGYFGWQDNKATLADLAQSIVDDNTPGNQLKVDFIHVPIYQAVPFSNALMEFGILPSEFSGYFSLKTKNGAPLSGACSASTADYSVRMVGDGRISMQIPGLAMMDIARCQPNSKG